MQYRGGASPSLELKFSFFACLALWHAEPHLGIQVDIVVPGGTPAANLLSPGCVSTQTLSSPGCPGIDPDRGGGLGFHRDRQAGRRNRNLLAASLIWLEYDAEDAKGLDEAVFRGYLTGLEEAGWRGDPRVARLGYTAACALRWGIVGLWWLRSLGDPAKEAELETHWNRFLPELASQWGKTVTYIHALTEESYQNQHDLF